MLEPKSSNFTSRWKPLPPLPEASLNRDSNLQATLFHQNGTVQVDGGIFIGGTRSTVFFSATPAVPQIKEPKVVGLGGNKIKNPVSSDELFQQQKSFPSRNHLPACPNGFNHSETDVTNGSFDQAHSTGTHRHNLEFLSSFWDPVVASGQADRVRLSMPANTYQPQPVVQYSPAAIVVAPSPQSMHQSNPPSSALPFPTVPFPDLFKLQAAAPLVQQLSYNPALKIDWCRDIFFLLKNHYQYVQGILFTDPALDTLTITDRALARLGRIAVAVALQIADSFTSEPNQQTSHWVAEAIAMRAMLAATGSFPQFVKRNPISAFCDYNIAVKHGFSDAWFELGRYYEAINNHTLAKDCFEHGVAFDVGNCLYRMGMAHLLGQLSLPPNPSTAIPLLHRAAILSSIGCPQPAYVYAMLLISEFNQISIPPTIFSPFIPNDSSMQLEARRHLERAAYLHFPPALWKIHHM